jgi:hypothetical protein
MMTDDFIKKIQKKQRKKSEKSRLKAHKSPLGELVGKILGKKGEIA